MPPTSFIRPGPDEHAPYYLRYIGKVPEGEFLGLMRAQLDETTGIFGALGEAQGDYAYAPGKWTIKEVLGHLVDTERVFAHRALNVARGEPTPLPGWDQDIWIAPGRFNERTLASLLEEWAITRRASLALLEGLPSDAPTRRGTVDGNSISARALACVLPGHLIWHLEVLKARYL